MTILSSAYFGFLAVAAVAITGCSPDGTIAPSERSRRPQSPTADIANLTTEPTLFSQTSVNNELQGSYGDQLPIIYADDFLVPEGEVWTVTAVSLTGQLFATSLPLSIRPDVNGLPGAPLPNADYLITPTASDPNACGCAFYAGGPVTDFLFPLPTPLILTAGTYWIAAQTSGPGGVLTFLWQEHDPPGGKVSAVTGIFNRTRWNASTTANDNSFVVFGTARSRSPQTITFPAITPSPASIGGTATLGATASSGLAISYSSLTPSVCTVIGNAVRLVGVGVCTVAANQAGSDSYDAATEVSQTVNVDYRFDGFRAPVKSRVLNAATAGQSIALKWRLTDASGAPVTSLVNARITITELDCTSGSTGNQVAEQAIGSGLQNLGDGTFQYDWKSPISYAKTCKLLELNLGEGSGPRTARFAFTK